MSQAIRIVLGCVKFCRRSLCGFQAAIAVWEWWVSRASAGVR